MQPGARIAYFKVGCDQCHGGEAQGSPYPSAPRLGPAALPIAAFTLFTRKPRLQMPPYSLEILSDADLADIYAYVRVGLNLSRSTDFPD